jgi:hypothetical protein
MMSCTTSAAWIHLVLSHCCTKHSQWRGVVLSGRITLQLCPGVVSWPDVTLQHGTVASSCMVCRSWWCCLPSHLAGASVMCEHALETRELIYVPRVAKHLFIPVVYSPSGTVGHVATPELSPRWGRVWSHRTRGSARAHLDREVMSKTEGHVAASELTSARS